MAVPITENGTSSIQHIAIHPPTRVPNKCNAVCQLHQIRQIPYGNETHLLPLADENSFDFDLVCNVTYLGLALRRKHIDAVIT